MSWSGLGYKNLLLFVDEMVRNSHNIRIFLKEVDNDYARLSLETKQQCAALLQTLSYSREELLGIVFWRYDKKDKARLLRLVTLISKEYWLTHLANEKKRQFWARWGDAYYQRLVEMMGEPAAKQQLLNNSYKWVEAAWWVVYLEEEKAFIMEQKKELASESGVNKKIAEVCNVKFHGWKSVRTADWIGKQYYKRKKKESE